MKDYRELLTRVLLKKAKGYTYKEKTKEYNVSDGEAALVKRKIATKHMHPDVAAVKALLQISQDEVDVSQMTDEQLQVEKLRLLALINACDSVDQPSQQITPQGERRDYDI